MLYQLSYSRLDDEASTRPVLDWSSSGLLWRGAEIG